MLVSNSYAFVEQNDLISCLTSLQTQSFQQKSYYHKIPIVLLYKQIFVISSTVITMLSKKLLLSRTKSYEIVKAHIGIFLACKKKRLGRQGSINLFGCGTKTFSLNYPLRKTFFTSIWKTLNFRK